MNRSPFPASLRGGKGLASPSFVITPMTVAVGFFMVRSPSASRWVQPIEVSGGGGEYSRGWRDGHDSNVRPSGSEPDALSG